MESGISWVASNTLAVGTLSSVLGREAWVAEHTVLAHRVEDSILPPSEHLLSITVHVGCRWLGHRSVLVSE